MVSEDEARLAKLRAAVEDLWWMSETDAPFEVWVWDGVQPFEAQSLRQQMGYAPMTPMQVISLADFFAPVLVPKPWHRQAEGQVLQRYEQLYKLLLQVLDSVKVYRIGDRQLDVYIVGRSPTGTWMGLRTQAIET